MLTHLNEIKNLKMSDSFFLTGLMYFKSWVDDLLLIELMICCDYIKFFSHNFFTLKFKNWLMLLS